MELTIVTGRSGRGIGVIAAANFEYNFHVVCCASSADASVQIVF